MSFSPEMLLSSAARQRCVQNLKSAAFKFDKNQIKKYASVLVPLCVHNGEVCLLYTLRSSQLKKHRGQVSFPGGMREGGETQVDTALRETEEEIGVPRSSVDVWGEMPPVQGRDPEISITPIVGLIKDFDPSNLKKNLDEVEEIFTVSMQELCSSENHAHVEYKNYPLPIFLAKHKIWGITGFVTNFFLQTFLPKEHYDPDFTRKKYIWADLMPAKL